jgi:hypothetical protein
MGWSDGYMVFFFLVYVQGGGVGQVLACLIVGDASLWDDCYVSYVHVHYEKRCTVCLGQFTTSSCNSWAWSASQLVFVDLSPSCFCCM